MHTFRRRNLFALCSGALGLASSAAAAEPVKTAGEEDRAFPRESNALPDIPVVDQNGKALRFYEDCIRDRAVIISYVYTRCAGSCPGTTEKAARLRRTLSPLLPGRLSFLTLTLDPEHDTPSVMAAYARDSVSDLDAAGLAPWTFLTGAARSMDALRRSLGYYDLDPALDADRSLHAAMFTFGEDTLNRWTALPVGISFSQLLTGAMRTMGRSTAERYHFHTAQAASR